MPFFSLATFIATLQCHFLVNRVSKPLVGPKMAISFELKLCLSNSSRERKTEGNQSANITLIFTIPVDLFLMPYFRPISANFQNEADHCKSKFSGVLHS